MRAARGEPIQLVDLVQWPIWTATLGKLFSLTEKSQVRRRSEREAERRRAAGEQGFLAGRRAWVQEHLMLLDRLENFGLNIRHVPGVQLASARELDSLAKDVRIVALPEPGRPAFLAALLHQYERDQALTHHIEDRLALIEPPAEQGQELLNAHQPRLLWDALTMLGVAGQLRVRITERISRGLDTDLTLHITSTRTLRNGPPTDIILTLPTGTPAWRVEFVTLGLVLAGAHCTQFWGTGKVPMPINLGSVATLTAFAPALFIAIFGTPRMRSTHTASGVAQYPGLWALIGVNYVSGFYASRMVTPLKGLLAGGIAAQLTASWLSSPRPRSSSAFGAELVWASATLIAGIRLARALGKLSARVAKENERQTSEHAQSQWMAGWAHQHREAELLHELAGHTIDQAQPETRSHLDEIEGARHEHLQLAEDLSRAARSPAP
jgi:hypothetical protein